jgi:diaminopimelate epimerase
LHPSETADVRIRIYNCDGTEAPFCGNAVRCVALRVRRSGSDSCTVETVSGLIPCTFESDRVTTKLPPPKVLHWDVHLDGVSSLPVCAVDTGVPHAVLLTDDPDPFDLEGFAGAVRSHPFWGGDGVNVNVVGRVSSEGTGVRIRTYERGVEGETPACGSGAAAAAFVTAIKRGSFTPLRMIPNSGEPLLCSFDEGPEGPLSVTGPARFVFQGSMDG